MSRGFEHDGRARRVSGRAFKKTFSTVTVIDSFEDGDLSEYTGGTNFSVVDEQNSTFSAVDGTSLVEATAKDDILSDGTLTLSKGSEFNVYTAMTGTSVGGTNHESRFLFGHEDSNNYYWLELGYGGDGLDLWEFDAGGATRIIDQNSIGLEADVWYEANVIWDDGTLGGNDGDFTVTLTKDSNGNELVTDATANSTANNGTAFGFKKAKTDTGSIVWDYLHKP